MKDKNIINNLENLKILREERNITQLKLSVDLGVSQELISRYEIGSSFPQPNMLIKLANYFNCSIDYLLGQTTIKTPVKKLTNNAELATASELYNKYTSLSIENKQCLDKFLNFLLFNN